MSNSLDAHEMIPEVANLAESIAYQPGSVVSKTLIKKKNGTVTLFAFSAGEGLSEHTSPYEALVYLLDGQAEISISGQAYRVGAGEALLLPADKPHALRALKDFKMLLIMVKS